MKIRYLDRLEQTLRTGLRSLPAELVRQIGEYVLRQQCHDGGFPNRQGEPDIYYTAFALRTLALANILDPSLLSPTYHWLDTLDPSQFPTMVSFYSLIQSRAIANYLRSREPIGKWEDFRSRASSCLSEFRTSDGGFAARRGSHSTTIYQTFLGLLCCELLDLSFPDLTSCTTWLSERQLADGGYADTATVPSSGTNPTAAAAAIWQMTGSVPPSVAERILQFLRSVYVPHTGFTAHARITIPDLLSTFTGLWTAYALGDTTFIAADKLTAHVCCLQSPEGGFWAGPWEVPGRISFLADAKHTAPDVEYTFYGLASLALLQAIRNTHSSSQNATNNGGN